MLDVIELFRESETVDELGIGSIRDAFADMLFPGTSTIMTRARYFLLIPWIYQHLEGRRVSSAQIEARGRNTEIDLIEHIEASNDNAGNIGRLARSNLKRLASSVYWQGLGVWGIRSFIGSQTQYYRSLDRYYQGQARHAGRLSERGSEHDDLIAPNWHGGLISPPPGFLTTCSLRLSRREAKYLAERITLSPGCSGSLLAALVRHGKREDDMTFAWEHPYYQRLNGKLSVQLDHARNFSALMHGAPLLYNLILAEQTNNDTRRDRYCLLLREWSDLIAERRQSLEHWKNGEFWTVVLDQNARITPNTRSFVNEWWQLVLDAGPRDIAHSEVARNLVTYRERQIKKQLARINNPRASELWGGDSGIAPLDYRWRISQILIGDIFDGLGGGDA
ncbi:DUF6361 family protein [Hyphomicrobium facile]